MARNAPSAVTAFFVTTPVARLVSATCAFVRTPPDESRTVPLSVARSTCALAVAAVRLRQSTAAIDHFDMESPSRLRGFKSYESRTTMMKRLRNVEENVASAVVLVRLGAGCWWLGCGLLLRGGGC